MTNMTKAARAAATLFGALCVLPQAGQAATVSGTLPVAATVTANCTLSTTAVAFGNVNVIGGANADSNGGITVTCTNGTAWSASAGVGAGAGASYANRRMTSGANLLNYNLYTSAARTTVWGNGGGGTGLLSGTGNGAAQTVVVYGRVGSGQTSVRAGSYADTVAVTVTY